MPFTLVSRRHFLCLLLLGIIMAKKEDTRTLQEIEEDRRDAKILSKPYIDDGTEPVVMSIEELQKAERKFKSNK